MSHSLIVALDAMGGDFGPPVTIPAADLALKKNPQLRFLMFGREADIAAELQNHKDLEARSEIHHTDRVIGMDEKPSNAIRTGRDSSMRLAIESVKKEKAHAVVSGGNTGALMAFAKMVLKTLPGIDRPAIASVFPTKGRDTVMLDLGANLHCDAEILVQFALMGAVFARVVLEVERPTVGLLNIGSEEMKGHESLRIASSVLSQADFPGEYIGFVEGNDITSGTIDVVVTDGFTGNVALKVAEGVGELTRHIMRDAFRSSLMGKLGALMATGALNKARARLDPRTHNGGLFLGLNGICVKSHGGMDAFGLSHAIEVAANIAGNQFNQKVTQDLGHLLAQESLVSNLMAQETESA